MKKPAEPLSASQALPRASNHTPATDAGTERAAAEKATWPRVALPESRARNQAAPRESRVREETARPTFVLVTRPPFRIANSSPASVPAQRVPVESTTMLLSFPAKGTE